jgi:hypothetical protein
MKTMLLSLIIATTALSFGAVTTAKAGVTRNATWHATAPTSSVSSTYVNTAIMTKAAPSIISKGFLPNGNAKKKPKPRSTRFLSGNFTWWGYRANPWETWAVATQSPSYINLHMGWLGSAMGFYVYAQAWVWRLTAQNARRMGQCLGITWAGSGIIVGCSTS